MIQHNAATTRPRARAVAETTGRKGPRGTLPGWLVLMMGRIADGLQHVIRARLPLGYQALWTARHGVPFDASRTARELSITFGPAETSIAETTRWFIDRGDLATA